MIYCNEGTVGFEGDYPTILADMFQIMNGFTEMSADLMKENNKIEPMLRDMFETFPETVTNFTKTFVKATQNKAYRSDV